MRLISVFKESKPPYLADAPVTRFTTNRLSILLPCARCCLSSLPAPDDRARLIGPSSSFSVAQTTSLDTTQESPDPPKGRSRRVSLYRSTQTLLSGNRLRDKKPSDHSPIITPLLRPSCRSL